MEQVLLPLQKIFPDRKYPELVVGLSNSDDAAVYKINDETAIIQTVDFFTPIVDDPYDFGAIAAANAMSDVFAMGGEVTLALNISCFPPDLDRNIVSEIIRGGAEKVLEAGGVIAGGHTVDDKELKYGLSVMGHVHPSKVITKDRAVPGDLVALTKPLGIGIITTALKDGAADPEHVAAAAESMKKLNRKPAQLMQKAGVNACTDITGYALIGHAHEMAEKSHVGISLHLDRIPLLDGARRYAEDQLFCGGTDRNRKFYSINIEFDPVVPEEMQKLLYTPETSGGLLITFPGEKQREITGLFDESEEPFWIIGEVSEGRGIRIT